MLKKSLILLTVVLLVSGIFTGCSASVQKSTTEVKEQGVKDQSTTASIATTYPLTIKDDTGAEVNIQSEPKRIISLIPSNTEILFALGLTGKVVAVTKYANYPKDVQDKVEYVFQDGLNPNMEQILNLQPDLIILGSLNKDLTNKVRELKIPIVTYSPQSIDAVYQTINSLGVLTNTQENAKQIVKEMKNKEKKISDQISKLKPEDKIRVWTEVSPDLWTPGKGTFLDEVITKAGGINIVNDQGWKQYNEEKVIAANPQVILTTYSYYVPNPAEKILAREGWQNVDAIINKRVIDLNSDLVTRPGPRIIDGMEEIAKALYPNLMK